VFFVRTASERDLPQVSALLAEAWHATYDALYGADRVAEITAKWHSVDALKVQLARRDAEFVVADDGKALGAMGYAAMSKTEPKVAILHQLYVLPQYQRHGIGRDMFAELETCFPDAKVMRLEVDPQNAQAIRFYEAHGFAKVGESASCGGDHAGIAALIFEKPIG
jgi:ribosomal protein S18 acetylase RimI-like enzyme